MDRNQAAVLNAIRKKRQATSQRGFGKLANGLKTKAVSNQLSKARVKMDHGSTDTLYRLTPW